MVDISSQVHTIAKITVLSAQDVFFAVNVAKLLLAHLVVTYDMKFEGKGAPPVQCIATLRVPRPADVISKIRQ